MHQTLTTIEKSINQGTNVLKAAKRRIKQDKELKNYIASLDQRSRALLRGRLAASKAEYRDLLLEEVARTATGKKEQVPRKRSRGRASKSKSKEKDGPLININTVVRRNHSPVKIVAPGVELESDEAQEAAAGENTEYDPAEQPPTGSPAMQMVTPMDDSQQAKYQELVDTYGMGPDEMAEEEEELDEMEEEPEELEEDQVEDHEDQIEDYEDQGPPPQPSNVERIEEDEEGDETVDWDLSKTRSRAHQSKGRTPQATKFTRQLETTGKESVPLTYSVRENNSSIRSGKQSP